MHEPNSYQGFVGETGIVPGVPALEGDASDPDSARDAAAWPVLYPLQRALLDLGLVLLASTALYLVFETTGAVEPIVDWAEAYPGLPFGALQLFGVMVALGFALIGFHRWVQLTGMLLREHEARQELRRKRDALERRNEELEGFAYAAAHDLREPLRMVETNLGLLEREIDDAALNGEAREFVGDARTAARHMEEMVHGLLDYVASPPKAHSSDTTDPEAALDDAIDEVALDAVPSVEVHHDELPLVEASHEDLQTVFEQLLNNALAHGGAQLSEIRVTGGREGSRAWLRVADDGVGIQASREDRLFHVFRHGQGSDPSAGLGLGLALCKRSLGRHDGTIEIDPDHDGEGARFLIELPAARPARADA